MFIHHLVKTTPCLPGIGELWRPPGSAGQVCPTLRPNVLPLFGYNMIQSSCWQPGFTHSSQQNHMHLVDCNHLVRDYLTTGMQSHASVLREQLVQVYYDCLPPQLQPLNIVMSISPHIIHSKTTVKVVPPDTTSGCISIQGYPMSCSAKYIFWRKT